MKVMVLGCGFHGRGIAYQVTAEGEDVELVAADKDGERARRVAGRTGGDWMELDVEDGGGAEERIGGGRHGLQCHWGRTICWGCRSWMRR